MAPHWTSVLEDEDWHFLKRFLLASGSLKALAKEYGISYPTVRARLDRLIAKVAAMDDGKVEDRFHQQLRALVAEGRIERSMALKLLQTHREVVDESNAGSGSGRIEV